jgi:hypothetical protein
MTLPEVSLNAQGLLYHKVSYPKCDVFLQKLWTDFTGCLLNNVGVLISLRLFLLAAQPKEFFLDGLKKLEHRNHECVELRVGYIE